MILPLTSGRLINILSLSRLLTRARKSLTTIMTIESLENAQSNEAWKPDDSDCCNMMMMPRKFRSKFSGKYLFS